MRAGCSALASATPVSASVALSTLCPADSSRNDDSVMFAGLSSTTSTFAISDYHFPTRHGAPDFEGEPARVEVGLCHDRRNVPIGLVTVFCGDGFGSDNQDRYRRRARILMERIHHVEPAHVRHQQIEHDQIR